MKKLFLLFAAGAIGVSANAQQMVNRSAAHLQAQKATATPSLDQTFNFTNTPVPSQAKTTLGGSRWYNFVDLLILYGSDPANNYGRSFMSDKKLVAHFGATAGYDTVFLTSFASVLDPSTSKFNDIGLATALGNPIAITNSNPYTLDSVRVYGEYRRKPNSTVTDTLRFAIVYGGGANTNIPTYYFTGMQGNFGYDTVRFAGIWHDTVRNIAGKAAATAPNVVIRDVYLNANNANDTAGTGSNFEGLNVYGVSVSGVTVPAGQLVGATVTFISGDNSIQTWDTAFLASGDIKHNHWRAWYFTEKTSAFQTYTPGDWNVGLTKYNDYYDRTGGGWRGLYIPSYAYTNPVWHENPLIDYKLTCATCNPIINSIDDLNNVTDIKAYPNPANDNITVAFGMNNAKVATVTISNAVGQVLASEKTNNGKAVFSTANFSSGIYFYTVEANGKKVTNRFVVAH